MKNLLLLPVFFFLISHNLSAQNDFPVKSQGIVSEVHQTNIGKIQFTTKEISAEELKSSDFLTRSDLTNKTNLVMNAFMGNSITNYVHLLSPALSREEVYKYGNLQFTFFVDGNMIFQENLNAGAGLPPRKDKETVLIRPFLRYPERSGWWSEYLWNRFRNNGGNKVLTAGKHLLRVELRPYVSFPTLKIGEIVSSGEIELEVKLPKIDITKVELNALKPYPGLPVSNELIDKIKMKYLKANIEEAEFRNISSVVIIKNGKILSEEYFNGATRDSFHDTRSVGKSFASTVAGIAIGESFLKNEEVTLKEIYDLAKFSNYSKLKENTSIKDLLTMSSVFEGNDDNSQSAGNEENMYPTADWVKFGLDLPIDTVRAIGEWHYFTAGVVLLGDILNRKVPGGLEKYADTKLFQPLGITNYKWQYTPQGVANTAGGLQMNALDYAKYGQLYKNGGQWEGKQVLPLAWVNKTFSKNKVIPGRNSEYYGYLFWNKTYDAAGKSYEAYYCSGNGGNKIYVFKDQPLVVVITATAYGAGYAHAQADKMISEFILPAVMNVK